MSAQQQHHFHVVVGSFIKASCSGRKGSQSGRQRRGRRGLPALGLQNTQVDPQHKEVISLSLLVVARVLVSDNILCAASFPSPTNGKKKKQSRRAGERPSAQPSIVAVVALQALMRASPLQPFVSACPPRTNDLRPSPCVLLSVGVCVCVCV